MRVFTGVLGDADDLCDLEDRFLLIVDEIDDIPMFWRQFRPAPAEDFTALLLPHCNFRVSIARAASSSSTSSPLRRSNDSALKRAIASSQVETAARALTVAAWGQTARNISPTTSSASVSSRPRRRANRYTRT